MKTENPRIKLIQKLVVKCHERKGAIENLCPSYGMFDIEDKKERRKLLGELKKLNDEVGMLINDIRESTGKRFVQWSDEALLLAALRFSNIFSHSDNINSRSLHEMVCGNKSEFVPKLLRDLKFAGISNYFALVWNHRREIYEFEIKNPEDLENLFLK